jgi:hypothetical protein
MKYNYVVVDSEGYSDPFLATSLGQAKAVVKEMLAEHSANAYSEAEPLHIYLLTPYGVATLKSTVTIKRV